MATQHKCKCGCGNLVTGPGLWLPGHDHKAVHQRIHRDHGSVAEFIDWYDATHKAKPRQRATRTSRS